MQSQNPKIATAEWPNDDKSILVITGNSVGSTSIYLRDIRNPNNFAEIKVISDYLSGNFKEYGDSANTFVQVGDFLIRETIENELKDIAKKRRESYSLLIKTQKSLKLIILYLPTIAVKEPELTTGTKTV